MPAYSLDQSLEAWLYPPITAAVNRLAVLLPQANTQVQEAFWFCIMLAVFFAVLGLVRLFILARPRLVQLMLRAFVLGLLRAMSAHLLWQHEWQLGLTFALIAVLAVHYWRRYFASDAVLAAMRYQPPDFRADDWRRVFGLYPPPIGRKKHLRQQWAKFWRKDYRLRVGKRFKSFRPSIGGACKLLVGGLQLGLNGIAFFLRSALAPVPPIKANAQKKPAPAVANQSKTPPKTHTSKPAPGASAQASPPSPTPKSPPPPPPPPPRYGGMSVPEALKLLALAADPTPEQIRTAHRRLMIKNHPDHGGDVQLAARINQARDVLTHL
jgi:hypothetical protein